jgi:predicted transcriptional regulator
MTPNQQRVLEHLQRQPDYLYGLCKALNLRTSTVQSALLSLIANGYIRKTKPPPHDSGGPNRIYYEAAQ